MNKPQKLRSVEYKKRFLKQLAKLPIRIQQRTRDRVADFLAGRNLQELHDHALTGNYLGYRSINVTGDVRALYYLREDGEVVVFALIGTHSQLYR